MIKKCAYCTNNFEALRSEATYCSDSCKTKAYNARQQGKTVNGLATPPVQVQDYFARRGDELDKMRQQIPTLADSLPRSVIHSHQHEHTPQKTDLGNHAAKHAITTGISVLKDAIMKPGNTTLSDTFFKPNALPFVSLAGSAIGGILGYNTMSKEGGFAQFITAVLGAGVGYILGNIVQEQMDRRAVEYHLPAFAGNQQRQIEEQNAVVIPTPVLASYVSSLQLPTVKIPSAYGDFVGDITLGCHILTYGAKDTGKSTFHYELARTLSGMGKVLYVSAERGVNEVGAALHGASVEVVSVYNADEILALLATQQYNYVIIDSLNGLYPGKRVSVDFIKALRRGNPQTTFFHVIQATKEGNYAVPEEVAHESDVMQMTGNDDAGYYIDVIRNKASGKLGRFMARRGVGQNVPVLKIGRV